MAVDPNVVRIDVRSEDGIQTAEYAILARFVITSPDANTIRCEQSFSDDGGKTWELNWVAVDTRLTESPAKSN